MKNQIKKLNKTNEYTNHSHKQQATQNSTTPKEKENTKSEHPKQCTQKTCFSICHFNYMTNKTPSGIKYCCLDEMNCQFDIIPTFEYNCL